MLRILDMQGVVRARIGLHGAASSVELEEGPPESRSERVRLRRELERGSSVLKDVAVVVGPAGQLRFVTGGFDKTIRVVDVVVPSE